jgi:hypothetical protein
MSIKFYSGYGTSQVCCDDYYARDALTYARDAVASMCLTYYCPDPTGCASLAGLLVCRGCSPDYLNTSGQPICLSFCNQMIHSCGVVAAGFIFNGDGFSGTLSCAGLPSSNCFNSAASVAVSSTIVALTAILAFLF